MSKFFQIKEIFGPTIQGEGSYSGQVVFFIRFAGCNRWSGLDKDKDRSICSFCDTDFYGGTKLSIDDILEKLPHNIKKQGHIVISGGEPLLQLTKELLTGIKKRNYFIHLETNGSMALGDRANYIDFITLSPKQALKDTKLEYCHDLKILYPYIKNDITPQNFAKFKVLAQRFLSPINHEKTISGRHSHFAFKEVLKLSDYRLSIQIHKVVGCE